MRGGYKGGREESVQIEQPHLDVASRPRRREARALVRKGCWSSILLSCVPLTQVRRGSRDASASAAGGFLVFGFGVFSHFFFWK